MASLEVFMLKIKPAMDSFLRAPERDNLARLEYELLQFNWLEMKIFHVQILLPLVLKLEELSDKNQELRTGTMNCVRIVLSNLYLKDVKGLRTILIILLRQIRDCSSATMRPNLSEEIQLAAVQCMTEAMRRSTSDVLELFYTNESSMLLGQMLLALVELIEQKKFRTLLLSSMQCVMVVFYVHDEADAGDVVLRNQVANTLFIYLPKIITILFKISLADEKLGETLKLTAIRALGRILCVMYEGTVEEVVQAHYDSNKFKRLINEVIQRPPETLTDTEKYAREKGKGDLEERLKRMHCDGRSKQWYATTSRKLVTIFKEISILRANESVRIRQEYAKMCCSLMRRCAINLQSNFVLMLESVVAMSEDADDDVSHLCADALQQLQCNSCNEGIFDESCELLFEEHLSKLPRIINRCDEAEQFAELLFLKGFLRRISADKLRLLMAVPTNLELFCMCLLAAVDLNTTHNLLNEEYSLHKLATTDYTECAKLHWRQYKNLSSTRCVRTVQEICEILGRTDDLNRLLFEHLSELLTQQHVAMNELILLLLWLTTSNASNTDSCLEMVQLLLEELLHDKHWHLALQPDKFWRLKVDKVTDWFEDHTLGLYESAIEVRTQDYDSDDENDYDAAGSRDRVTVGDAQFNVLHTCLILDALAHCAFCLGETFDRYLFRSLHRVLLKIACTNSMVYQAAIFALMSIQKALRFAKISQLIETHTDYITYHLNTILKRSPQSHSAVDILTVLLQFSTRNALPHLDNIFQTLRDECTKGYQSENINSYLKVFNAFLTHICRWQCVSDEKVTDVLMQVDSVSCTEDLFTSWLKVLEQPDSTEEAINFDIIETSIVNMEDEKTETNAEEQEAVATESKPSLPHHIEVITDILNQVLKFVSSGSKIHQILSLECLITGLPLIRDYENELLPLVHLIWQPLMEKFRQKDPLVLNRCFTLLTLLATCSKEFILKRSLDDVVPFLRLFLKKAADNSATENIKVQTQEYKLQLKLLREFPILIQFMEIDGKPLHEIAEVITLYLSQEQPQELQTLSVQFFRELRFYNGPLLYVIVLKILHLKEYKQNAVKVLTDFGIK